MERVEGALVPKYSIVIQPECSIMMHVTDGKQRTQDSPHEAKPREPGKAEAGAHAGSLVPHPTTSTGGSSSPKFIIALLVSQWKEARLCGSMGSCGTNPHRLGRKEGTDYLLKHNRVLHKLVVSLFGMEVMELTRCLD